MGSKPPGGLLDLLGAGEIREALRQVHRAVRQRVPGHLADDRFGEPPRFIREARGGDAVGRCSQCEGLCRTGRSPDEEIIRRQTRLGPSSVFGWQ
jgi:hypothetical protein